MSSGRNPGVILFNPATWRGVGDTTAPWGLVSLCTFLVDHFDVTLVDQRFDKDWQETVRRLLSRGNIVLAGTTAMTGLQLKGALEFMKLVKGCSDVPTVFGGVHASILPLQTVAHEAVDYVVVGEGENVLPALAGALARGVDPRGDSEAEYVRSVVWKGKTDFECASVADLDALPAPPHSLFAMERYVGASPYGRMLSVLTSRGCPHGCTFCIHSARDARSQWRAMSAEKTVDLLFTLASDLAVEHFHIQDDNFFVSTARVEKVVALLNERRPTFTWTLGGAHVAHLKHYSPDFFRTMRSAGCVRLLIGAESASQEVLSRVGKKQTPQQVMDINRNLTEAGIRPIYSFISGVPDETDDDLRATVELMARLRKSGGQVDVGTIKPLIFYPGSTLYSWALDNGFVPPETVEGWIGISWDHYLELPYPWLSQSRRRFLIRLYYYSLLWNPDYHWVSSPLFTGAARMLMPLTEWRLKRLEFRLGLLPSVLRWIQHIALSR